MTSPKRLAATGGAGPAIYVDDVFSTWLYTGNGSTQTITNGIDLTKGGLVWVKQRNGTFPNILSDSAQGFQKALVSNSTAAVDAITNGVTFPNGSVSSTGLVLGSNTESNQSGSTFASWTFREAEKFFDVVTFSTGASTNTNLRVSHNLGSVPGCMILKRTDGAGDWVVWHRSLASATNSSLNLNVTSAVTTRTNTWGTSGPTSTDFGIDNTYFGTNATYVAYLFAHNAGGFGASGSDNVISCGSFTGTNYSNGDIVNLGYEPQWLLVKNISVSSGWVLVDTMRGLPAPGANSNYLEPNTSTAEQSDSGYYKINSTGFQGGNPTSGANTFIYIAIRRPHKPPTSGTQVFAPVVRTGTGSAATISGVGFTPDYAHIKSRSVSAADGSNYVIDRLRGGDNRLSTNFADAESQVSGLLRFNMDGVSLNSSAGINASGESFINYLLRRAPGFFDEVCYTGTGNGQVINHNLGAVPELAIFKGRNVAGADWVVRPPGTVTDRFLLLNTTNAQSTASNWYSANSTTVTFPTSYGGTAQSGTTFVAHLFASSPGISQVGTYTGNGSSQTINCGFAAGARFVMIKRTDSTGGWFVWDTARGINPSGTNDPYVLINSANGEVTNNDSLSSQSVGFGVIQNSTTNINVNAATYIFLAIA